ncbi:MAG: 2-oxoacid:ferredoxin oxidoreductase subunit gamma, partial [Spirochaetes bacterium]
MKSLYEIRLSGSGGQGLVTAGMVLGEAASLFDNKKVIQTQSYGAQARGGVVASELIISDEEITFPKPVKTDILLALSQLAYNRYIESVKPDSYTIVDSSLVKYNPAKGVYPVPITKLAEEETGLKVTANVVALGVLSFLTGVVSYKALERALMSRIPPGTEDVNKRALQVGKKLT